MNQPDSMKFHIISGQGTVYFLRVEPGMCNSDLRALFGEYIRHAFADIVDVNEFAFDVKNPNLDEFVKPIICGKYEFDGSYEMIIANRDKAIDKIKDILRSYTCLAGNVVDSIRYPFTRTSQRPYTPEDGIYVYFNSKSKKYIITRKMFPFYYVDEFIFKWKEVDLPEIANQFMFSTDLCISTTDENIVNTYRKFVESLVVKRVCGVQEFPDNCSGFPKLTTDEYDTKVPDQLKNYYSPDTCDGAKLIENDNKKSKDEFVMITPFGRDCKLTSIKHSPLHIARHKREMMINQSRTIGM